jgi:selenocysteine-specific elongation factor
MRVIGTAGHVDHGKSTLVEALTGTHPDRLKEEREREMTIDLGFAWMALPNGEEVGIIDVPGHRDFIENMLAGVGGIDAALFVVAADEGVMPQTREHLAILNILQIRGGVVALTKIDMVEDDDWLDLVEEDVRQALSGTVLGQAPIVRVSARSGEGLPGLLQVLAGRLAETPPRPDLGRPRLPVDRIFTISGFGTVVTGTLTEGRLKVGDEVEILPAALKGRVRGLQTHKRKEDTAVPGSRTAVNISGVTVDQIQRGEVVAHPGDYRPTRRLDVRFHLLPDASQPVRHNIETKLFIGTAEVVARLRLLGSEELRPGEEGWLQLELSEPVVAVRGDHYILRRPSPGETLGGGVVVDPHPKGRHKRFSAENLARLDALAQGTPADVLLQALLALGAAPLKEVVVRSNLDAAAAAQAIEELLGQGQLVTLEDGVQGRAVQGQGAALSPQSDALVASRGYWDTLTSRILHELENYHRSYPLKKGMPREELKSRLKASTRLYNIALRRLVSAGALQESGPLLHLPGHEISFNPQQQRAVDRLLARFAASPTSPPSTKESIAEVGEDLFTALLDLGLLAAVAPDVVFRQEDYARMAAEVRRLLEQKGTLTAAEVRDHFNTSRRYVLALLEHLDATGVTVREGDARRLKRS